MLKWRAVELSLSAALVLGCVEGAVPGRVAETRRSLTLLHSSDLHSRAWPFRVRVSELEAQWGLGPPNTLVEVGGLSRWGGLLERERSRGPLLWLDSGDALEGSSLFRRFGGEVELSLLSTLGLGAMALGNHELSLSGTELADRLRHAARFPVLSANLRPWPGSPLAGVLMPWAIVETSGLKVGVVGLANPGSPPSVELAENRWQLAALGSAAAVQSALDALVPRADLLVVLSHAGLEADRELVRATSGIDLVLGGHQHFVTVQPDWQTDCQERQLRQQRNCRSRPVPIVHSGSYGKLLSRLTLQLSSAESGPGFDIAGLELEQLASGPAAPESAAVAAQLDPFWPDPEPPLAFLTEPLWRRSALGGDAPLGNLVADAVRQATGADVAILNSSGLRADLEAGALLRSDLDLALPFDEPWLLSWLPGRTLRAGLELAARRSAARQCQSSIQLAGLRIVVRCAACRAGSADCLTVVRPTPFGALPLDDSELLRVALPTYLTQPGADFAAVGGGASAPARGPVSDWVAEHVVARPAASAPRAPADCVAELENLSPTRCRESFGSVGCPVTRERAVAHCQRLPQLGGARDERIVLLP